MARALIATDQIAGRIVVLRGEKVLLDSDLAELYAVPLCGRNQGAAAGG